MNDEEVGAFVDKIKTEGNLSEPERDLLDAIFKVASAIREEGEPAFTGEFGDAFTKKHADLVLEYVSGAHDFQASPPTIFRSPYQANRIIMMPPPDLPPDA
jgi:hypothetical protein